MPPPPHSRKSAVTYSESHIEHHSPGPKQLPLQKMAAGEDRKTRPYQMLIFSNIREKRGARSTLSCFTTRATSFQSTSGFSQESADFAGAFLHSAASWKNLSHSALVLLRCFAISRTPSRKSFLDSFVCS